MVAKAIVSALLSVAAILALPGKTPPATQHFNNSTVQQKTQQVQVKPNEMTPSRVRIEEKRTPPVQEVSPQPAKPVEPETPKAQAKAEVQTQVPQGCESYRPLLAKYNWDVNTMYAIMRAESSCNPTAVNTHNYDGVYDYGLLQLHGQVIYNPAANIEAGYNIWKRQGYTAWSVFNTGAYLKYL